MSDKREITITRIFNAPRNLVWKAWTEPERIKKWWGPNNLTTPFSEIDLRVGGKYLTCMQTEEGQKYWVTGKYVEITPQTRLVYTDNFSDEKGNIMKPSDLGFPGDWSDEILVSITFEDHESGKTKMTLVNTGIPSGEISDMTVVSWNESFDKLSNNLK